MSMVDGGGQQSDAWLAPVLTQTHGFMTAAGDGASAVRNVAHAQGCVVEDTFDGLRAAVSDEAGRAGKACVRCRQHRLKCDNQRPCSRCVERNEAAACVDQVRERTQHPKSAGLCRASDSCCLVQLRCIGGELTARLPIFAGTKLVVRSMPKCARQVRQRATVLALCAASHGKLMHQQGRLRVEPWSCSQSRTCPRSNAAFRGAEFRSRCKGSASSFSGLPLARTTVSDEG
jgi:hypothetical protein